VSAGAISILWTPVFTQTEARRHLLGVGADVCSTSTFFARPIFRY